MFRDFKDEEVIRMDIEDFEDYSYLIGSRQKPSYSQKMNSLGNNFRPIYNYALSCALNNGTIELKDMEVTGNRSKNIQRRLKVADIPEKMVPKEWSLAGLGYTILFMKEPLTGARRRRFKDAYGNTYRIEIVGRVTFADYDYPNRPFGYPVVVLRQIIE